MIKQEEKNLCPEEFSNTSEKILRGWYDAVFRLGKETHQILCGNIS